MTEKENNKIILYKNCRKAEEQGWNLNDIDTYTGIDKMGLLIPYNFVSIDLNSNFLKTHRDYKGNFVTDGITKIGRIYVKKLNSNFNSNCYSISFSLSRLVNGINISSYTPLDINSIRNKLDQCLRKEGFYVNNWNECQISMLEIFRNIILLDKSSEYTRIFRSLHFPRLKNLNFENTTYFQTDRRTTKLSIYDKGLESINKTRTKPKLTIMRVEFKTSKKCKIKGIFERYVNGYDYRDIDTNLTRLTEFNMDKFFTDKMKIFLEPLLRMRDISIGSSDLESELQQLYSKNKNGSRLAQVSTQILDEYQKGLLNIRLNSLADQIIKPSIRANSSPDREKRVQRKAKELLSNAILMDEIVKHGYSRIDELITGLLSTRPKQNAA